MIRTHANQFRGIQSFIKSVLLIEDAPENPEHKPDDSTPSQYYTILDLCCSGGVDITKLAKYSFFKHFHYKKYYVGLDTSSSSIDAATKKWSIDRNKPFPADFYCIDLDQDANPKWTNLSPSKVQNKGKFSSVICFNEFEKFFANENCIHSMLQFVSSNLKDGGFFFGMCIDSSQVFLQSIEKGVLETTKIDDKDAKYMSIKGDLYELQIFKNFGKIGTPYALKVKGEEPPTNPLGSKPKQLPKQYLIHFPTFIRIAEQYQLLCIHITNFAQFYEDYKEFYQTELDAYQVFKPNMERRVLPEQAELLDYFTTFAFVKLSESQRELRKQGLLFEPPKPQHRT